MGESIKHLLALGLIFGGIILIDKLSDGKVDAEWDEEEE